MIKSIVPGNITARTNVADIIIGMNTALAEISHSSLNLLPHVKHSLPLNLGAVLSFELDMRRHLHMVVCHNIGKGGWQNADKFLRIGLDYLWYRYKSERYFSIVEIGTGQSGKRDGANSLALRKATESSYLEVDLHVFDSPTPLALENIQNKVKEVWAYRYWDPLTGQEKDLR